MKVNRRTHRLSMPRDRHLSKHITGACFLLLTLWIAGNSGNGAEREIQSLRDRFSLDASEEASSSSAPDFQKHISPLLGKLGCNGRACHGSFQGQGGFMLSLFGYDFDIDHKALLDPERGRVNVKTPSESLILTKPIDESMHGGGKIFSPDRWEYLALKSWIEDGARKLPVKKGPRLALTKLDVTPKEIILDRSQKSVPLRIVAHWNDGTREDVTELSRFFSNDTSIADIDGEGVVTAGSLSAAHPGDTHVVVSYDKAVVPVAVLRPGPNAGSLKTEIASAKSEVDRLVLTKLNKLGIQPSPICSESEFYRRVCLDLTGTLPTEEQVRVYVADKSPDKRARAIEALLQTPGYAAQWTTFLCDITGNSDVQLRNISFVASSPASYWYQWIYARVADNIPYDQIVEGIVSSASREPGESYRKYCEVMSEIAMDSTGKSFAERETMPYFWARANARNADDRAIAFAYSFCGVRIQCAQCHKHPFDQWSKQDFDQFKRVFARVSSSLGTMSSEGKQVFESMIEDLGIDKATRGNELIREIGELRKKGDKGLVYPFPELVVIPPKATPKKGGGKIIKAKGAKAKAVLLGDEAINLEEYNDPRVPLMEWLRSSDNPYFAKALVNRVWARYFEVGIVNPPDDLNLANAPSNQALLDYLADGFIESGYDLHWVHRTILNSDTYQRSWEANPTNEVDRRNFSHTLLRRLPAETAYDALKIALSSDSQARAICDLNLSRALSMPASLGANARANRMAQGPDPYALKVFGRSIRESNCDCDRSSDPNLLQTVFIKNDSDVLDALTDPKNSWLSQIATQYNWQFPTETSPTSEKSAAKETQRKMQESKLSSNAAGTQSRQQQMDLLDRRVRTLKAQILKAERLDANANENRIKDLKPRLANAERKLARLLQEVSQTNEQTNAPNSTPKAVESREVDTATREELVQCIESAYLRTLSRFPEKREVEISLRAIENAKSPIDGLGDLLWALINSKEFILNH